MYVCHIPWFTPCIFYQLTFSSSGTKYKEVNIFVKVKKLMIRLNYYSFI